MDDKNGNLKKRNPMNIIFMDINNNQLDNFTCNRLSSIPVPNIGDNVILHNDKRYIVLSRLYKYTEMNDINIAIELEILLSEVSQTNI